MWQGTSLLLQEVRGGERKVHVALLIISLCKNVDLLGCFECKDSSIYKGNVDKTEKVLKTIYQNNGQCSCSNNVHIQIDYPNRGLNRRVIVVEVIASNLENC